VVRREGEREKAEFNDICAQQGIYLEQWFLNQGGMQTIITLGNGGGRLGGGVRLLFHPSFIHSDMLRSMNVCLESS
jgi:hypothetical protein